MSATSRPYDERDGSEFQKYDRFTVEYRDASHFYWLHHDDKREQVVSVTSALRVLSKNLDQWNEEMGAIGAITLERAGLLQGIPPERVIHEVRERGMGAKAKRDAGGAKGTTTHSVLEHWVREGEVPNLADFPAGHRGYVQGACAFLLKARPKVIAAERIVGSLTHLYAGRMDFRGEINGRDCVVDYKTNRQGRVYPEMHLQARAYAMADVECGSESPEGILIVAIGIDGSYEMVECEADERDWLAVLECHRALKRVTGAQTNRLKLEAAA